MNSAVRVALAQLDLAVGDVAGNTQRIVETALHARDELEAHLVVFPELSVCGYPPEDLLFHKGLREAVERALETIRRDIHGIAVLVGYPEYAEDGLFNACSVYEDGRLLCHYRKQVLPNYSVFDEKRYFVEGRKPAVFRFRDIRIGLNICEDVWQAAPLAASHSAGAEVVIAINGSPYDVTSQPNRELIVAERVRENALPVLYVNMVGGQDELVFDGGSFAMDANGELCHRAPAFDEELALITLKPGSAKVSV